MAADSLPKLAALDRHQEAMLGFISQHAKIIDELYEKGRIKYRVKVAYVIINFVMNSAIIIIIFVIAHLEHVVYTE